MTTKLSNLEYALRDIFDGKYKERYPFFKIGDRVRILFTENGIRALSEVCEITGMCGKTEEDARYHVEFVHSCIPVNTKFEQAAYSFLRHGDLFFVSRLE